MRKPFSWPLGLGVAVVLVAGGCKTTAQPVAGELTVNLTTPNSDDGAILVRITGTGGQVVTGASASCSGCRLFSGAVSDTELRAVITGSIGAGAIARVSVSDVNQPGAYSVQILDVASRTYVKRAITGYSLALQ
jgi:hypothetical protein